jgi:glycosyltransferase involved in cell wall biosynthesis
VRTSVVIETWNAVLDGPGCLARSLDLLGAQHPAPDEVILVDGGTGCSASLREVAAARLPGATWVEASGAGYYDQKNAGARHASGHAIVFLDSDVVAGPHWLSSITDALAQGASVVTGMTRYEEGRLWRLFTLSVFGAQQVGRRRRVGSFIANNVGFRADVWRASGGFRAGGRVGACAQLSADLRAAGYEIVVEPKALCRHRLDASPRALIRLQTRFGFSAWKARRNHAGLPGSRLAHLGPASPFLLSAGWLAKDLARLPRASRVLGVPVLLVPLYAVGLAVIRLITLWAMMVALVRPSHYPRRFGW